MPTLDQLLPRRRVALEPMTETVDLDRAVYRFAAAGGFIDRERIAIIAPHESRPGGPVAGPAGFELFASRVSSRTARTIHAGHDHVVLHVVEGSVRVNELGRTTDLGIRDTQLIAPGTAVSVSALGSEATLVEIRFAPRQGGRTASGVARPSQIRPIRERFPVRWMPRLNDILSPQTLYPIIGSHRFGPSRFAIRGPGEISIGLATTPRGTGPALHVHRHSTEMFLVLAGRFRVSWGEAGEHATVLDPLDAIVMPRGVNRAFEACGDGENWLLPIVVGTRDEAEDIVFLPAVERQLYEAGPKPLVRLAASFGLRFGDRRR